MRRDGQILGQWAGCDSGEQQGVPAEFEALCHVQVKVADLVAFAQAHTNERGYLNLVISERREVGQYGDTHSVTLDTYVSQAKEPGGMAGPALESPPIHDDDIPF